MVPQTVAIEDEPFDSRMSETTRIVYGKSSAIGKDGVDAPLGQGTVTNFTPARTADRAALTNAEAWEVVIEHELLGVLIEEVRQPVARRDPYRE